MQVLIDQTHQNWSSQKSPSSESNIHTIGLCIGRSHGIKYFCPTLSSFPPTLCDLMNFCVDNLEFEPSDLDIFSRHFSALTNLLPGGFCILGVYLAASPDFDICFDDCSPLFALLSHPSPFLLLHTGENEHILFNDNNDTNAVESSILYTPLSPFFLCVRSFIKANEIDSIADNLLPLFRYKSSIFLAKDNLALADAFAENNVFIHLFKMYSSKSCQLHLSGGIVNITLFLLKTETCTTLFNEMMKDFHTTLSQQLALKSNSTLPQRVFFSMIPDNHFFLFSDYFSPSQERIGDLKIRIEKLLSYHWTKDTEQFLLEYNHLEKSENENPSSSLNIKKVPIIKICFSVSILLIAFLISKIYGWPFL